jgi:GTP-binding protein EngB required for normal cell division
LEKHLPVSLEALDRRAELLHSALGAKTRLDIGFVGESQVGKSTLLNALLEEYALPSGGIGPLTAQAIHVHHSTQPFFRVKYHSKKTLNETRFAIESYLAALKKTEAPQLIEESDSGRELLNALTSDDDSKESRRTGDELLDTIGRVFGIPPETEEHASVTTSALRLALGQDTIRTVQFDKQTNDRIRAVSELLDTDCTIREDGDRQPFADALRLRAAGWHSPLVSELELHLNSSLLETLNLVDLPGVGTINDPSQLATRDFVKHGDALVLVVRNNGVTKAIVQLLEKAEFITRWIWASDLDHPPIHAMVVVTHLDDVARGRYSEEKQRTRDSGERPTSRDLIFAGIAKEMQDKILHDMKAELLRSPSFDELEEDQRTKRTQIVEAMCSDLQVHCVAAPDALELILGDDDDAFLRDLGTTGIPRLRMALTHMAQEYLKRRHDRLHYSFEQFSILLRRQVQLAVRRYNEAPEVGLVKRFREVADPMLAILKKEMQGLHGRCMSKLSEGIPDKIALLCAKA